MDKMVRQGIHDLLDRVLDADPSPWPKFWLTCKSNGRTSLKVSLRDITIDQDFGPDNEGEAIARARAATDE